jgi:hypothetical protein
MYHDDCHGLQHGFSGRCTNGAVVSWHSVDNFGGDDDRCGTDWKAKMNVDPRWERLALARSALRMLRRAAQRSQVDCDPKSVKRESSATTMMSKLHLGYRLQQLRHTAASQTNSSKTKKS